MAVVLTVSETVNGASVTSGSGDLLQGGQRGVDIGNVTNGAYTPLGTDQETNDGAQLIYVRHDATLDPITSVKIYIDEITPALTGGNSYGGAKTAAQDKTDLISQGQASGSNGENTDGLSGGVWIDMDYLANNTNRFSQSTRPATVKIFGDAGTDGISAASAFTLHADSMLYWNGTTEIDATTPVSGSVGISTDTVLGNRSKLQLRLYVRTDWPDGGYVQWSHGLIYSFTA